ncbi:MAG: SDR family NAD(P)-dependent oxidoreductase [Bacteroidota bacterium]
MIAITGASGLLGTFIVSYFISEGEDVVALKRKESDTTSLEQLHNKFLWREADVLDPISLSESFKGVDTVIHSAALVSFNARKVREIFEVNVMGTKNVVDTCLTIGVKKLIYISSVAALGRQKGINQITEESHWIDSRLESDYARSKYQAELEVFRGYEEGLHISIVNPSVILAPADWNKSSSRIFKYIWDERPFYTNGILNYVDVRDVAKMVYLLHTANFNGERFIASADHVSYKEIFDKIAKRFNKKKPSIKVNPSFTRLVASIEGLRCLLTKQEPIITMQLARMACDPFHYDNTKAVEKLKINFKTLDETLDFCCKYHGQKITINK